MVRASVVQLLLFTAAITAAMLFVGGIVTQSGLYAQSVEDEGERETATIDAEIAIINDPGARLLYNETDERVTMYVKNVGDETLEPADVDVLLNGELATVSRTRVIGDGPWRRDRVLEVTLEYALDAGANRALVRIDGSRDRFSFRYAGSLIWSTDGAWSAGTHNRTVSDDIGDRDADTVRLGYGAAADGLDAYWPFDEGSGDTAIDAAGDDNGTHVAGDDGTGPALDRPGLIGTTAYGFNGSGARVSVPDSESLRREGNATFSVWLRTTELGTSTASDNRSTLFEKSDWENKTGYALFDNGDYASDLVFRAMGNDTTFDVSVDRSRVNDGDWHHVAAVLDGSELRLYVDDQLRDTETNATLEPAPVDLHIGAESNGTAPYEGDLDEMQLYNRSLTDAGVSSLFRTTANGTHTTGWRETTDPLVADYLQLENVSATLDGGNATVTVESDTTGDGTADEVSDPIALTEGDATYSVAGLETDNDRFRLRLEFETGDVMRTPIVSRIELTQE